MPVPPFGHEPAATPVAVVFGGPSAEHDVSVVSGTAIAEALSDAGYPVSTWLIDLEGGWWWLPDGHRREGRPQAAYDDPAAGAGYRPDIALVNFYGADSRMGMHQDRDEAADDPVVSLSLGAACVFRIGNTENRGRPYTDLVLDSGDLVVVGRENRLAYHGVPRMVPSFAAEDIGLPEGRINITLRVSGLQD